MSELLYGRHAVIEALRAGRRRFYRLWIETKQATDAPPRSGPLGEIVAQAEAAGIPVRTVRGGMFDKMRDERTNAQGVALEAGDYPYVDVEACLARARQAGEPPLLLILDHLQVTAPSDLHQRLAALDGREEPGRIMHFRGGAKELRVVGAGGLFQCFWNNALRIHGHPGRTHRGKIERLDLAGGPPQ